MKNQGSLDRRVECAVSEFTGFLETVLWLASREAKLVSIEERIAALEFGREMHGCDSM